MARPSRSILPTALLLGVLLALDAHAYGARVGSHGPGRIGTDLPALLATDRTSRGGQTSLDVTFGYAELRDGKQEILAGVVLTMPFDRALRAHRPRAPVEPSDEGPPDRMAPSGSLPAIAGPSPRVSKPSDGPLAGAARKPSNGSHAVPAGPLLEDEPCDETSPSSPRQAPTRAARWSPPRIGARELRAATAAAERNTRLDREQDALDDLASRARWSAAMPELRLRATRLVDESEALAPTQYDAERMTYRGGTSLWLEARGTWKLDRAVFADEEIRLARLRHELDRERQRARTRVVGLLFEWQRATLALVRDAGEPIACWEAWLRAEQHAAEIDLLTGGWFTRWTARDPRRRPAIRCGQP